jgi:hypothetical protein
MPVVSKNTAKGAAPLIRLEITPGNEMAAMFPVVVHIPDATETVVL